MSHANTYTLRFVDTVHNLTSAYRLRLNEELAGDTMDREAVTKYLEKFLADNYEHVQRILTLNPAHFEMSPIYFELVQATPMNPDISRLQQLRSQVAGLPLTPNKISPQQTVMKLCVTSVPVGSIVTAEVQTCTPEQIFITIPRPSSTPKAVALTLTFEATALYTGGPYLGDHALASSQQLDIVNATLGKDGVTVVPDPMPSGKKSDVNASRVISNGSATFFHQQDADVVIPAQTRSHTVVGISETRDPRTGKPVYVAATDACSNHYGNADVALFSATGYAQVVLATRPLQVASKIPVLNTLVHKAVKGGTPGPYFELAFNPVELEDAWEVRVLFRGSCFPRMLVKILIQIPGVQLAEDSYALYVDPTRPDQSVNGAAYEKLFTTHSFETVSVLHVNKKTGKISEFSMQTLRETPKLLHALERCGDQRDADGYAYAGKMRRHFMPGCTLGHSMNALRVDAPGLPFQLGRARFVENVIGRTVAWFAGLLTPKSESLVVNPYSEPTEQHTVLSRPFAHHCMIKDSYAEVTASLQASPHCVTRIDLETTLNEHTVLDVGFRVMEEYFANKGKECHELQALKARYLTLRDSMLEILFENQQHHSGDERADSRRIRYSQVRGAITIAILHIESLVRIIHTEVVQEMLADSAVHRLPIEFHEILMCAVKTKEKLESYYYKIALENHRREERLCPEEGLVLAKQEARQKAIALLYTDIEALKKYLEDSMPFIPVPRPLSPCVVNQALDSASRFTALTHRADSLAIRSPSEGVSVPRGERAFQYAVEPSIKELSDDEEAQSDLSSPSKTSKPH